MKSKKNDDKIILDLCGGTGAWSRPYKEAGYKVIVITLPDYDIAKFYQGYTDKKWLVFPKGQTRTTWVEISKIYGILAAPPCTQFSFARNDKKARAPRDFQKGLIVVDVCLQVIRACQLSGFLKFWAMENPKGYLRRFLGKPYLETCPSDYGDPFTKPTDVWGYFNKPQKKPVSPAGGPDRWSDGSRFTSKDKVSPDCTDEYFKKVGEERRIIRRSITPPGFAKAFFKANR